MDPISASYGGGESGAVTDGGIMKKKEAGSRKQEWSGVCGVRARKVDVRLPEKSDSNSYGATPVHLIVTMIKQDSTRTGR